MAGKTNTQDSPATEGEPKPQRLSDTVRYWIVIGPVLLMVAASLVVLCWAGTSTQNQALDFLTRFDTEGMAVLARSAEYVGASLTGIPPIFLLTHSAVARLTQGTGALARRKARNKLAARFSPLIFAFMTVGIVILLCAVYYDLLITIYTARALAG